MPIIHGPTTVKRLCYTEETDMPLKVIHIPSIAYRIVIYSLNTRPAPLQLSQPNEDYVPTCTPAPSTSALWTMCMKTYVRLTAYRPTGSSELQYEGSFLVLETSLHSRPIPNPTLHRPTEAHQAHLHARSLLLLKSKSTRIPNPKPKPIRKRNPTPKTHCHHSPPPTPYGRKFDSAYALAPFSHDRTTNYSYPFELTHPHISDVLPR
ncbi:hypothetical protein BDP27DRAFT_1429969 [Rhodocollybia butyracea]|uniref:Uncharacterized protein n=1 Tax=Rhodocollybia butyracea TaxID=206335 RepID=A0A9P5PBZ7_9AGAR|nr:hypothetical protein BDP27DRAFT_1429969 [Rhodocollybia butyracea]